MNVILTCVGGPLDGKYEFQDFSPASMPPQDNSNRLLAWMLLATTRGEPGKGAGSYSPAAFDLLTKDGKAAPGAAAHSYVISERREDGETVFVSAKYMPQATRPPSQPMLISEFTIDQLIQELVNRQQFAGVIAWAMRTKQRELPKAGDTITYATNLNPATTRKLLESVLKLPEFGN